MKIPDGSRLPFFLQTLRLIIQPIEFLETCAQSYGETFTLRLFGVNSPPVVFLSHPQTIQKIFTTEAEKFELGKVTYVFQPLTGAQSLIMLDGEQHQAIRQVLMPPLHGKQVSAYGSAIAGIVEEVISPWSVGSSFSIRQYMSDISLQVILRLVFGLDPGTRYKQLKALIEPFLEGVTSPLNSIQFFWTPLQQDLGKWSPWGRFLRQRQEIDDLVYAEIASRRDRPDDDSILSLLMSARNAQGEGMSDGELRDQLMTLLLLGHETTASGLAWAFYWIHKYPSVLEKLRQEIDSLGTQPDPMEIAQLPYLNAVCQEALRVYPIALISQPRVVKETVCLEGYEFDPGVILIPCIYLAHRRREVFPEPDRFKPERFLNQKFSPYEYLPFGGGTRSCIGMALSLLEMKLVLAKVLSYYQLELSDKDSVKPVRRGITIVPSGGCQMVIKQRLIFNQPQVEFQKR